MNYARLFQQLHELWQLSLSSYTQKSHIRRNLSVAACMDYTSPTTARSPPPRSGASCRAVVEISECNSYMSQRLDSLRRDFFLFKGTAWAAINQGSCWRSVIHSRHSVGENWCYRKVIKKKDSG